MSSVTVVQSDTAPSIFSALTESDGSEMDLTDATSIRFQMRSLIDRRFTVNAVATIVTANEGLVRYDWQPGDLATAGEYEVRWRIAWSDGSFQHTDPADTLTIASQ